MFASALAEAVTTTATSSSYSYNFELNLSTIISILFVGYFVVIGLACIFTGKVYGFGKAAKDYTDESLAKFARPFGLAELLIGVAVALLDLYLVIGIKEMPLLIGGIVVAVLAVVIAGVSAGKTLVKKDKQ